MSSNVLQDCQMTFTTASTRDQDNNMKISTFLLLISTFLLLVYPGFLRNWPAFRRACLDRTIFAEKLASLTACLCKNGLRNPGAEVRYAQWATLSAKVRRKFSTDCSTPIGQVLTPCRVRHRQTRRSHGTIACCLSAH